jgi:hypothetical protein
MNAKRSESDCMPFGCLMPLLLLESINKGPVLLRRSKLGEHELRPRGVRGKVKYTLRKYFSGVTQW